MEHLKTIETFLKMATAAQAAQDEVVALEADIEKQVVHDNIHGFPADSKKNARTYSTGYCGPLAVPSRVRSFWPKI